MVKFGGTVLVITYKYTQKLPTILKRFSRVPLKFAQVYLGSLTALPRPGQVGKKDLGYSSLCQKVKKKQIHTGTGSGWITLVAE